MDVIYFIGLPLIRFGLGFFAVTQAILRAGRGTKNLIHQRVFHGLLRREVEISVRIPGNLVVGLSGVLNQKAANRVLQPQNLPGRNLNITGLTLRSTDRLVHVDG